VPVLLCPPQILQDLAWNSIRTAAVGSRLQIAGGEARLIQIHIYQDEVEVEVKVELSLCLTKHYAMKAYGEFFIFGTRWRWVVGEMYGKQPHCYLLCIFAKCISLPRSRPIQTTNSVASVHERSIPTERPHLVNEVSANFCG
jgi:hypothetical protein